MSGRTSLAEVIPAAVVELPTKETDTATPTESRKPAVPIVDRPFYATLDRREARIYPDQSDRVDDIVTRLNRQRRGRGERITANTLIRVALDLLLEREADLAGVTEDDLLAAVGQPARNQSVPE